ncbi:ABC-2 family transporter protein [Phycisphaerae bacterium RAS1]|nr:ABC-2 family transporter protein [Phycisphaerae bacterium RAS1]
MNRAVVLKTARDTFWLALVATVGIMLFEMLFVRAMREVPVEIANYWLGHKVFSRLIEALVGARLAENLTPTTLVTIGFAHPLVFALTWALLLTVCTRVIVGEIERGTADLLLTLPISRTRIYLSTSVVWMLAGIPVSLAPWLGMCLAQRFVPLWEPIDLQRLAMLPVNLYLLYLSIGSSATLVSSLTSRRGAAVAIVLTALLASFVLNFLSALWPAAKHVAFVGILNYYQPLPMARDGVWPIGHLAALAGFALAAWLAGLIIFRRRDIPAA